MTACSRERRDFLDALRITLPIFGAFMFLGVTYGLLAFNLGYPLWVPLAMAVIVYSGSVEFIALTMLAAPFNPLAAAVMALTVGARHFSYGITMLRPWRHAGRKKPFLVLLMTDETFALNYANGGSMRRQLMVSALNYVYWISGAAVGYLSGRALPASVLEKLQGLDFVLTAMFVAIFMDDFVKHPSTRRSGWLGIGVTAAALALFGPQHFIPPTMAAIFLALYIAYKHSDKPTV